MFGAGPWSLIPSAETKSENGRNEQRLQGRETKEDGRVPIDERGPYKGNNILDSPDAIDQTPPIQGVRRMALWPWEAEPYRLWSLLDMLPANVGALMWIDVRLDQATVYLAQGPLFAPHGEPLPKHLDGMEYLKTALAAMDTQCKELPLSPHVSAETERIRRLIRDLADLPGRNETLIQAILGFQELIRRELSQHLFMMIPGSEARYYMPKDPLFGPLVDKHLNDANRDIAEAGKCYALGQWTASVFHLIRAVEHGVRVLVRTLPQTVKVPIEYQEWNDLLAAIDNWTVPSYIQV